MYSLSLLIDYYVIKFNNLLCYLQGRTAQRHNEASLLPHWQYLKGYKKKRQPIRSIEWYENRFRGESDQWPSRQSLRWTRAVQHELMSCAFGTIHEDNINLFFNYFVITFGSLPFPLCSSFYVFMYFCLSLSVISSLALSLFLSISPPLSLSSLSLSIYLSLFSVSI
jgi:hypothetical protein